MDTDKSAVKEKVSALKDPVCGMSVTAQSTHHLKHNNNSIYFCSVSCKAKFKDNPNKYSTIATGAKQSTAPLFRSEEHTSELQSQ